MQNLLWAVGFFIIGAMISGVEVAIALGLVGFFFGYIFSAEKNDAARPESSSGDDEQPAAASAAAVPAPAPSPAPSSSRMTRIDALAWRVNQLEREVAELRELVRAGQLAPVAAAGQETAQAATHAATHAAHEPEATHPETSAAVAPESAAAHERTDEVLLPPALAEARSIPAVATSPSTESELLSLPAVVEPVVSQPVHDSDALELPPIAAATAPEETAHAATDDQLRASIPAEPVRAPVDAPLPPDEPDWISRGFQFCKNWLLGGNSVVRVGVLILFFGVAFLLKYAVDSNLLPIELRLAGVALGASALLLTGWRLRHSRRMYGLILQGGAVGILYITAFVTLKLFNLLPAGVVLGFLIILAILSALLAIKQDASSLAVMGITGGFLAPLLTSTGGGSHVMLFSYFALLNAGIFGMAWFKSWRSLNLLGFAFTFGVATLWGVLRYRPELMASTLPFLALFFAFYLLIAILYALHREFDVRHYLDGTLVFGTPLITLALLARLMQGLEFGLAWSAVVLAVVYLGLTGWLKRSYPGRVQLLAESFLALGVLFATLAIPLAFDGPTTAAMWALEGAAIVWVSLRQQRRLALAFALLLQLGAAIAVLAHWQVAAANALPLFNSACISGLLLALGALFSCHLLQRRPQPEWLPVWLPLIATAAGALGGAWWFVTGWLEIARLYANAGLADTQAQSLGLLLFVTASLLLAGWLSKRLAWPMLRWPALSLPVAIALWSLPLIHAGHPAGSLGWLVLPLVYAAGWWQLRRHEGELSLAGLLHLLLVWSLAGLLIRELVWQLKLYLPEGIWFYMAVPFVSGAILLLVSGLTRCTVWPLVKHRRVYLELAPLPLLPALAVWFCWALLSDGNPAPLAYVPLLNPLDVGVLLSLVAVLGWLRRVNGESLWRLPATAAPLLLCTVLLPWLTADVLRLFHHYAELPYSLDTLLNSLKVQSALVLFWAALAVLLPPRIRQPESRLVFRGAAAAVLGLLVFWSILANTSNAQVLAWRYIPFLNLLELAQLAALAGGYLHWKQFRTERGTGPALPDWLLYGGSAVLFLLLNAMLLRSAHSGWDLQYSLAAIADSSVLQRCFVLLWLLAAALGMCLCWRGREARLLPVAGGLLGCLWLWLIVANLNDDGGRLAHVPLLNPLDLLQVLILLLLGSWFVLMAKAGQLAALSRRNVYRFLGLTAFFWLNAVLLRTIHHWAGVPYEWHALTHSMLVQSALSLFWTVLALMLMVWSTRLIQRTLWLAGGVLLIAVVAKLFLLDLSHVSGMARIVSFIGVGLLLLLIGYLAPLPPASKPVAGEGRA